MDKSKLLQVRISAAMKAAIQERAVKEYLTVSTWVLRTLAKELEKKGKS